MSGLEYKVECSYDEDEVEFVHRINKWLSEGWELVGGVSMSCGRDINFAFAQALCRSTDAKE